MNDVTRFRNGLRVSLRMRQRESAIFNAINSRQTQSFTKRDSLGGEWKIRSRRHQQLAPARPSEIVDSGVIDFQGVKPDIGRRGGRNTGPLFVTDATSDQTQQFVDLTYRRVILDRAGLRAFKQENPGTNMELEFRLEYSADPRLEVTLIADDGPLPPIRMTRHITSAGITLGVGNQRVGHERESSGNVVRVEELEVDPSRFDADFVLTFSLSGRRVQFIRATWQIVEIF